MCKTSLTRKSIKLFLFILLTCFSNYLLAQIPATFTTKYRQLRIATQTKEEDPVVDATCIIWYLDKINSGSISYTGCNNLEPTTYKISSSEPLKGTSTNWSKRYFGYDPKYLTTLKGVHLDDMTFTIVYKDGNYSMATVFSTVNEQTEQTESSVMIVYYNL